MKIQISDSIEILKPAQTVWTALSDIALSKDYLSSILNIEILNEPADSFIDFKWKETRNFMGSESSEIMWITESEANSHFISRAESHGSVYISQKSLREIPGGTELTVSFSGEAQTMIAKLLNFIMKPFILKSLRRELAKDLEETKRYLENSL